MIVPQETLLKLLLAGMSGWVDDGYVVIIDENASYIDDLARVTADRRSISDHFVIKDEQDLILLTAGNRHHLKTPREDHRFADTHVVPPAVMEQLPGWRTIGRASSQAGLASLRAGATIQVGSARVTTRGIRH